MMKTYALFLLVLPLLFVGCGGEEVDVTAPSMKILSLTPEPTASEVCGAVEDSVFFLTGGETLQAELLFSDNAALSQYKIDIHNNFDCHGHGGAAVPSVPIPDVASQTTDWSVLNLNDLSGNSEQVTLQLTPPANVTAGTYHFQIQVVDESGNDNPMANFYTIKAINPDDAEAPQLSLSSPSAGSLSYARGEEAVFTGQVSDNYSLSEGGNGIVFLSYTDLSSGNTFAARDAFVTFDASTGKDAEFEIRFTVPNTIQPGDYRFRIDAHDGVRNVAEPVIFDVAITN